MKKIALTLLALILICGGCGMAALSYYATPTNINKQAVEYAVENGAAKAEEFEGYPNLVKAQKLEKAVDAGHNLKQLDLQQQAQKDNLEYSIHKDVVSSDVIAGQQREEMFFGPKGFLAMGLSMAGFGGLTGFLGLMRKRPGDITKDEADAAVAQATGKSQEEIAAKTKAFAEVVKGVEIFKNNYKKTNGDVAILQMLKDAFDIQDSSTQIEVQKVLKG